jgi:hypothetical protein
MISLICGIFLLKSLIHRDNNTLVTKGEAQEEIGRHTSNNTKKTGRMKKSRYLMYSMTLQWKIIV